MDLNQVYIETLMGEMLELQKTKVALTAQLSFAQANLQEMTALKNRIENANNDLLAKLKERKPK